MYSTCDTVPSILAESRQACGAAAEVPVVGRTISWLRYTRTSQRSRLYHHLRAPFAVARCFIQRRQRPSPSHTMAAAAAAAANSKSQLLAKRLADHGRHIFVYNHIWTGQTVYSLDRTLNVHLPMPLHLRPSRTDMSHSECRCLETTRLRWQEVAPFHNPQGHLAAALDSQLSLCSPGPSRLPKTTRVSQIARAIMDHSHPRSQRRSPRPRQPLRTTTHCATAQEAA